MGWKENLKYVNFNMQKEGDQQPESEGENKEWLMSQEPREKRMFYTTGNGCQDWVPPRGQLK